MMKKRAVKLLKTKIKSGTLGVFGFILIFTNACSKDLKSTKLTSTTSNALNAVAKQAATSKDASGAHMEFHFKNFYTLTNPSAETSCAGDMKTYYKPPLVENTTGAPIAYDADLALTSETIRPAFIKNVSVDLTDANATSIQNQASSCAYNPLNNGVPTSNCATFDYGAIGGIPTNLGGTLMIFGGTTGDSYGSYPDTSVQGTTYYHGTTVSCGPTRSGLLNYPDETTLCNPNLYTLNIDSLPASIATSKGNALVPGLNSASEPISAWGNLSTNTDYVGPPATAAGSIAYNQETQQLVLFGGSKVVTTQGPTSAGVDTNETWVYDLKKEKWNKIETQANSTSKITNQLGFTVTTPASTWSSSTNQVNLLQQSKSPGPRALFGYAAVPKMSVKTFSTTGAVDFTNSIDTTERILVLGGLNAAGVGRDTYKFNPTFGPELMDSLGRGTPIPNAANLPAAGKLSQWADTFPFQPLFNFGYGTFNGLAYAGVSANYDYDEMLFNPDFADSASVTAANRAYSFGFAPLLINNGATYFGSALAVAGFDYNVATNYVPTTYATPATAGGRISYLGRYGSASTETIKSSNFLGIASDLQSTSDTLGVTGSLNSGNLTPMVWRSVTDSNTAGDTQAVPWYGGGNLVSGFSKEYNDFIFFGGSTCRQFLTDTTLTGCSFANPQRYWRFDDATPTHSFTTLGDPTAVSLATIPSVTIPIAVAFATSQAVDSPDRAGMAADRGRDESGNTIVVAWGGMDAVGSLTTTTSATNVYLLYNTGTTAVPVPTWKAITPTTDSPANAANAQLVYSHVTGKFYLYGGLRMVNGSLKSSGETWELTITGNTAVTFAAEWRRLDTAGAMTCFPECPSVRRSHRMTEVNYNNTTPTAAQPTCNALLGVTPCSFGIFMEGGTSDGYTLLSDRWMFDPTANGGVGHWQRVDTFPPRHLAAMTSISYYVPSLQKKVNRTLMFGGETSFHSPQQGRTGEYFVAPTLGDTWMFDHDTKAWNRVELLGKGYNGAVSGITFPSEFEKRQAYNAAVPAPTTISELAPPALSGAMMVARTFPQALKNASTAVTPLAIPQIYLFGGRTKDGKTLGFDSVYKFCAGSTGERWGTVADSTSTYSQSATETNDDASCDAYSTTSSNTNSISQSPVAEFKGRWLRKYTGTTADAANFTHPDAGTDRAVYGGSIYSYLGAAAYDPLHDKIAVYGGMGDSSTPAQTAITATTRVASSTGVPVAPETSTDYVYEYTFPTKSATDLDVLGTKYQLNGYWSRIHSCQYTNTTVTIPTARHGHTMAFDQLNKTLVVVGGYGIDGSLLYQTNSATAVSATYETPEVWTAQRIDSAEEFPSDYNYDDNATLSSQFPCYFWKKKTTFSNSTQIAAQIPPTSTVREGQVNMHAALGHTAAVYIPAAGYNTGYYTFQDKSCAKAGPVASSDPAVSKLNAGGIYIDLDRSELGTRENVLLNLTYIPLGINNQRPDGSPLAANEEAVIKVHLMKTNQSRGQIQMTYQPRYLMYSASDQFPKTVHTLSLLAPPTGEVRTDQVLIPLGIDSSIDRIRIERYSGSAILIDAGVFRMGGD